jgi:hypothetical protein
MSEETWETAPSLSLLCEDITGSQSSENQEAGPNQTPDTWTLILISHSPEF